ncbi:hypothetical protein AY605_07305 [Acinetobacter sp. SFD]|uniref:hypothetical protein n=1 Tax=Acinetobacter sp. SFD TaxID=1805635 RepID=UPI0007D0B577|nr:hypothetical protein [Acinetobacter sp. SFD]OAL84463.1 hypothetical protein AY605_07305 [Acinetobacter sp. SFD]
MAARKVNTPGATEKAPAADTTPIGATELDPKGEKATGEMSEALQDQSTNETSSLGALVEPTAEELTAKKEYEEFLQWRKTKGEAVKPVKATVQQLQSQTAEVKRIQNVLTERGWDSVEE